MDIKQLSSIIKTERKKQNITQRQLAGLCNVGERFIVDLEAGKETCQIAKVLKVLYILGLRVKIGDYDE